MTQEWTDKHYNLTYALTESDKSSGFVKLDPYLVSKVWKVGSKDDSGALWHCLKTIARFGEKNSKEREIKALYAQIKRLAEINNVELEDVAEDTLQTNLEEDESKFFDNGKEIAKLLDGKSGVWKGIAENSKDSEVISKEIADKNSPLKPRVLDDSSEWIEHAGDGSTCLR